MMNGELTSQEAQVLRGEMQTLGTTVLRALQEVRNSVHESIADQSELVGRVLGEVGTVRSDVREIKTFLGMETGPRPPRPSSPKHPPHAHTHTPLKRFGHQDSPPSSERPSLPPQFAEEEDNIKVTSTGSYHIPPDALDRISARLNRMEEKKRSDEEDLNDRLSKMEEAKLRAEAETAGKEQLRKELAEKNEKLSGRVKFVILIAGAFVAFVTTTVGLIEWSFRHVH